MGAVSTGTRILGMLARLGVTVELIGVDRIRLAPASRIPENLIPIIRNEKPEILEALRNRECGLECYFIGEGKRIHRPWSGRCEAKVKKFIPRQIERTCWHCSGSGRCKCIVCAEGLPSAIEAECTVCAGIGKVAAWIH